MNNFELNNENLWEWLDFSKSNTTIYDYLNTIKEYKHSNNYISLSHASSSDSNDKIMDKLRHCIPYEYFLQIQYCVMTYSRLFSKIFPNLSVYIGQLAYIEWLQYTEPSGIGKYRDHLVHMFKVAFTGHQFLSDKNFLIEITKNQFDSKHFQEWLEDNKISVKETSQQDIIKISCFLASIFHDFGYGYDFLTKYRKRLYKLYPWLLPENHIMDAGNLNAEPFLRSLPAKFIFKNHSCFNKLKTDKNHLISGFIRDHMSLNHSMASTLFVLDHTEKLRTAGALTDELYVAFQIAAEAVMIHDMTGEKCWLHLEKEEKNLHFLNQDSHKKVPVAMLLILSDELGVWERPTIKTDNTHNNSISFTFEYPVTEVQVSINDKTISLSGDPEKFKNIKKLEFLKLGNEYKIFNYSLIME